MFFFLWLEGIISKSFIFSYKHYEIKPKMTTFLCCFCSKLLQEKFGIEILYLFILVLLNASSIFSTLFCPLMTNTKYCLKSFPSSPLSRSWLKTYFLPRWENLKAVWTERSSLMALRNLSHRSHPPPQPGSAQPPSQLHSNTAISVSAGG